MNELIEGLKEYFRFYNRERPHQSLGGRTPAEAYFENVDLTRAAPGIEVASKCDDTLKEDINGFDIGGHLR